MYKSILSYIGLIILLSGIGFVITFVYFVYEMITGVRRFDFIILLFALVLSAVSLIVDYKIIIANRH